MLSFPVFALLVFVALWWFTRRRPLFVVSVRDGRARLVAGRIPPGLLDDIRDIVARPAVARGTIKGFLDKDGAALVVSGAIDDGRAQRLRNVFRLYPLAKLRDAPAARPGDAR